MMNEQKFVDFHKYCPLCVHAKKSENEDPCWDCLGRGVNNFSAKPINFEESTEKHDDRKCNKCKSKKRKKIK